MKTEHFGALPVEDSTSTKKKFSFPMDRAKKQKMNTIPFDYPYDSSNFPEDTIVKEIDHAGGYTTYYVFQGRTLVRTKRTHMNPPHYGLARRLREEYGEDLAGPKKHWNPLDHRTDDHKGYKTNIELPAKFIDENSE